ncbi:MAG: hypothetical protein ABH800_01955 [Candidatus Nealsonbacteria bacterium]
MTPRQILVSVWQGRCIKVDDLLSLVDRFDFEVVVDVLRDLSNRIITVAEAEQDLIERRKKCIH